MPFWNVHWESIDRKARCQSEGQVNDTMLCHCPMLLGHAVPIPINVIHHLQLDSDSPKVVTQNATNSSRREQQLAQTIGFMTRLPA